MTSAHDPPTVPLHLSTLADGASLERLQRHSSRTLVRTTWTLFWLVVLAFYAVPTIAALGWW